MVEIQVVLIEQEFLLPQFFSKFDSILRSDRQ